MAYSDLTLQEMVQISALWITPSGKDAENNDILTYRPLIEQVALLAAMLEVLEEVQQSLVSYSEAEAKGPPDIKKIRDAQRLLDKRHDALIRALYRLYELLAELTGDVALRTRLLAMLKQLLPDGLIATTRSYTEEAGAVRQLEGRLTGEDKAFLADLTVEIKGHLVLNGLALVEELIEKGKRLGDLEEMKKKLSKNVPEEPPPLSEYQLKRLWATHVTTFVRLVQTAKISKEDKDKLLGTLYRLEEEAAKRAAEERAEAKAEETKTPPQGAPKGSTPIPQNDPTPEES